MALDRNGLSANAINSFEPQRMNNWTLEIPDLGDDGLPIVLGLQSFQLPTENTDLIEIFYMNESRKYAGRTMYDGGQLSLVDWIDKGTAEAIRKWRRRIYDPESGRVGIKSDYAQDGTLTLYAPGNPGALGDDGAPTVTRRWRLYNMWPLSVSWGALDMAGSEKISIDVQMVYDKAMPFDRGGDFAPVSLGGTT